MKIRVKSLCHLSAMLAFTAVMPVLHAQLSIPNADGSDGALIVSNSMTIDLRLAGTGSWTTNSANPGFGTYDPTQWAVVFKYSNVVISNGATLTFSNHPTHAPVVWLAQSNVTINGVLSLDGQPAISGPALPEPGPGGFRGGNGQFYSWTGSGLGFGPGGGVTTYGGGNFSSAYGNAQILPLIGGSGGCGGDGAGGGGGGAILIASSGSIIINVNGSCRARGGTGGSNAGGGSGGGIRLVASQITGSGTVLAQGPQTGFPGGDGRIRLECTNTSSFTLASITPTPTTQALSPGATPTIFTNASTATIVGIVYSGLTNQVPIDPRAEFNVGGNDDVRIVTTNKVTILVRTMNFPTNGFVDVYVKPLSGYNNSDNKSRYSAIFDGGDFNSATWHVTTDLPYPKHTILQARAYY